MNSIPNSPGRKAELLGAAETYLEHGWEVVPLREGKGPPPAGLTGMDGKAATLARIRRYIERGYSNLAIRMPSGVIGLDIDAYDGKAGADSLAILEGQFELPETSISTSREDGVSGIRFYQVPPGEVYRANPFPGIEIIQRHHRYAVVWPSVHPSGREYRWEPGIPYVRDLPWLNGLSATLGTGDGPAPEFDDALRRRFARIAGGDPCEAMLATRDYWLRKMDVAKAGGAHDAARDGSHAIVGDAVAGHTGAESALVALRDAFRDAAGPRRGQRQIEDEWLSMVRRSISKADLDGDRPGDPCTEVDWSKAAPRRISTGEPVGPRERPEPVILAAVPDYPTESLTGPLWGLVEGSSLPAVLVAGAGLAALAGACGNASLRMPDGTEQNPALWIPLIAPSGGGKSPAIGAAMGVLRDLDTSSHPAYRAELAEWRATPPKERTAPRPVDPTLLTDDFTMELLARHLDNGDGVTVVVSDELQGFLRGLGQYKHGGGSDQARALTLWSGEPWRYERVTGDIDILIPRPVISVCGGIQPHLHADLGDDESGLRPRWLPHISADDDVRFAKKPVVPEEWEEALAWLYEHRKRRTWKLKGEALELWRKSVERWKTAAKANDAGTSLHRALLKADIQSARIALVFAESLSAGSARESSAIQVEAMRAAVAVTDFAMDCWRAMPAYESFALTRRDVVVFTKVQRLLAWLESRATKMATRAEIQKSKVGGVQSAKDTDILLAEFERAYPGTVTRERTGKRGPGSVVVRAPERR